MNPRTMSARNVAQFPVPAYEGQTPITGFPGDLQDVSIVGIGEALEFERAWLASIASLQSCTIGVCKNTSGGPSVLAPFLDAMMTNFDLFLELQMNWINLFLPPVGSTLAAGPRRQDPAEEEASEVAEDFAVETFENF